MSVLDDAMIFLTVIQERGFTKAAKKLSLSNGFISRRITYLEKTLGVSLIKRTTRQLHLTAEGEIFLQSALKIKQELDSALCVLQSQSDKPKGELTISCSMFLGRQFLIPILTQFLKKVDTIKINVILTNQMVDPIKENVDLLIRSTGYFAEDLKDSSMKVRTLLQRPIQLYASRDYLRDYGEPKTVAELKQHRTVGFADRGSIHKQETWHYIHKQKPGMINLQPAFNCNDIESNILMCGAGLGIAKFSTVATQTLLQEKQIQLQSILNDYEWGKYTVYALYAQQSILPKRLRLLLDFIEAQKIGA